MSELAVYLIIGAIVGIVARVIYDARHKSTGGNAKTIGKPEFKYNSWYGCVMMRKGSYEETFMKALSVGYIGMFLALLSPVIFFAFVILFGILNSILPGEVAILVSLFVFVVTIGRVIYIAWRELTTFYTADSFSKSSTSERSFSEASHSEWSFSEMSCSSDSGVVNITITSRR